MTIFLKPEDLIELTGRQRKSSQIEALRIMGIPFYVNANGRPVVTKSAVETRDQAQEPIKTKWQPPIRL